MDPRDLRISHSLGLVSDLYQEKIVGNDKDSQILFLSSTHTHIREYNPKHICTCIRDKQIFFKKKEKAY